MKKVFALMMAVLAITTVSCKKDNKGGDDDEKTIAKPTYRVTKMLKSWEGDDKESGDSYIYKWNADGTIDQVEMAWAKEVYSIMKFNYSGNTVSVVDTKKDNKPICTITLNDQKLATKIEQAANSEVGDFTKLEITYDANGFLTSAKVNDKINTVQKIDEDGNVEWWGRIGVESLVDATTTATGWRKKMHTYYNQVNAAGIHGEWDEDVKVKRWFYETGLVGRASAQVMRTAWWYGIVNKDKTEVEPKYAEKLAYYPLDVDDHGCVVTETKLYDTETQYKSDPSKMKGDDLCAFVCEKIK